MRSISKGVDSRDPMLGGRDGCARKGYAVQFNKLRTYISSAH